MRPLHTGDAFGTIELLHQSHDVTQPLSLTIGAALGDWALTSTPPHGNAVDDVALEMESSDIIKGKLIREEVHPPKNDDYTCLAL